MKLNRRSFIKFAVGAAAGIHVTPLPWKIMDDVAIWTQNWPWVPRLPRFPELSYSQSVCTLCPGGCGLKVCLVNEQKTITVEGSEAAPVNQGHVCPLGAAGPQYQYGLARFPSPLKRIGARGSGKFARISWEEALGEVAAKLGQLRRTGQAHTLVFLNGRQNSLVGELAQRFMQAYGSPNLVWMPSGTDGQEMAERAMFGRTNSLGYDLENSRFILSFGCGLIEGWGSPVRSIGVYSRWRAQSGRDRPKLVQIDSRASLTASKADEWVAVAPGTEGALALGLAHILIREGLFDQGFVAENTSGFEEFKAVVLEEYAPSEVSTLTGVPPEDMVKLAREFARTKPAVALGGKGRGEMPCSVYELMAIHALNALVGNINRRGGVIIRRPLPLTPWPELRLDETAEKGLARPRLDEAGSDKYPLARSLLGNLVEAIHAGRPYPVEALLLYRANPAYFGPDPPAFRAALDKVPFVVSLSGQGDDTSIYADLVLPECANFEGPADVVNPPTLPYPLFGRGEAVLAEPFFKAKPAGDILLALARALGGPIREAFPWERYNDLLDEKAAGLFESGRGRVAEGDEGPGYEFGAPEKPLPYKDKGEFGQALAAGQFWYDPAFRFGDLAEGFATPSGRFEFVSQTLKAKLTRFVTSRSEAQAWSELGVSKGAQAFLPHFEPYLPLEKEGGYPLLLVPVEQFKLVTSAMGNAPYLTKLLEDTTLKGNDLFVEVHPRTARKFRLAQGDRAWLVTRKGKRRVRVHLFEGARPGVVYAPVGLGHLGFDLYLKGKGVNPLEIVEATKDPLSGQSLWWGTRAKLLKV